MKKKRMIPVVVLVVLILATALCLYFWHKERGQAQMNDAVPSRIIYYYHGQSCEITDEKAFEEFVAIAGRYQVQAGKDWYGVPDFDVDAQETDAAMAKKFPENRVIHFAYDDEEYDYLNYDVYFYLDEHYTISVPRSEVGSEDQPDRTYMAFKLISWQTCHAYSQEMENAVEEFGLYELLE